MSILNPKMTTSELNQKSSLALAHIGDAVLELMYRTSHIKNGIETAKNLHKLSTELANAKAQSLAAEAILPLLTEAELTVFKRAKNTKMSRIPKNASVSEYHLSSALEALFGYLYLLGDLDRIEDLFKNMEGAVK